MSTRRIAYVAVMAALYVVIGFYITPLLPNPMVRGAVIAINMVVVVIAGILFGPTVGALVGLIGTSLNAVVGPAASRPFEVAAIIPHLIMGFSAGWVARISRPVAALTILVGHVLNIAAFIIVRLIPLSDLTATIFSVGLLVEAIIDIVVIWLAVAVLTPVVRSAPA
ncbi:MAG TPA: ECF transporter S component [bacterium]|jgi:uncharacterized membrane protein|nr:ECF transporter S component [bacterium]